MIPTTDEKLKSALWETARVINIILNEAKPPEPLFNRTLLAYHRALDALKDERRDQFIRDMDTPAAPNPETPEGKK